MPILPQRREGEIDGDFARRRARFVLHAFLLLLPITIWAFARLERIWMAILPLEGTLFLLAATVLGAVLAITPVATLATLLLAVWYGVESVYLPRTRPTPQLDRLIVVVGLLVWFSPTIALAGGALRAILSGSIAFSRPQREYLLATDPIAFWQSVGFLLVVAAALAYPAWQYWSSRLARRRDFPT